MTVKGSSNIRIDAYNIIMQPTSQALFFKPIQFTEEKLGQAEKTELDAHLENLLGKAECTKQWTEKVMKQTEVLLQPNPSKRRACVSFVVDKIVY